MWSRALQKHRDCINGFGWSVMHMTLKEQIILNHYKTIIEKRAFDEYDILGFLIFIRAWVTNDGVIREFCDLIAHRERNQGRVMRCIEGAIKNDYECIAGSKKVKGYHNMNDKIKVLFLDIDNTLLDFDAAAAWAMEQCFQKAGLEYNEIPQWAIRWYSLFVSSQYRTNFANYNRRHPTQSFCLLYDPRRNKRTRQSV